MLSTKNWVWLPEWTAQDKQEPAIVCFRRTFVLQKAPQSLPLCISADSRYKLYVNGALAAFGPCKGDRTVWYYDTVDLAPYLTPGKNVLAAVVLRYPLEADKGNASVFRTDTPGLYVQGDYTDGGKTYSLSADENWKCIRDPLVRILPENPVLTHLVITEQAAGSAALHGWKTAEYADDTWQAAKPLGWDLTKRFQSSPADLRPRPIPPMTKIPRRFSCVHKCRESILPAADWERLLAGQGTVRIPAHTHVCVELSAGELMTGFIRLAFCSGRGAAVWLLCAESYYLQQAEDKWVKKDRTDCENGRLQGLTDSYAVAGCGTQNLPECYEPFWFRTFRFVQLEVTTGEDPLTIQELSYQETGYPLEVKTKVRTSDASMQAIWEISERTLRRCMQETYTDCPFYEQMQYAMDARSQILYTYAAAADDRLARKCFADFRRSQRYDGMIACCYPNMSFCVIPGFSIYYILMLHDHMMYFGDKALVRGCLASVDAVLEYFADNLAENGLVGKLGGQLFREGAWSFIDWAAQWDATGGMPPAGLTGPLTMDSLLYIMGLLHGAELAQYVGRADTAAEYRQRAQQVQKAVRENCIGSDGMVQDGPGVEQYSQHCQVFAVLTDTIDSTQGAKNIRRTLEEPARYAQCSVAMAWYLFRGLEKCGLYAYTDRCWDTWRDMLKNNLTTCVEEPVNQRSDCHAWGALALYELPAVVLGVRPTKPGFEAFTLTPVPGAFDWAEGEVITPKGMIQVQWKKKDDGVDVHWKKIEK